MNFDTVDLQISQQIVASRADKDAGVNRAFYDGDHWQDGKGWAGPMPRPDVAGGAAIAMQEIQKAFVSRNAVAEIVNRHVNGVLGRELHWKLTTVRPLGTVETTDPATGATVTEDEQPDETEQALIAEAEAALVLWWDQRRIKAQLQNMTANLLNSKRSPLRIYVPPGVRDEQGNVPLGDLAQSLGRIWLQDLATNEDTLRLLAPSATVYTDRKSRQDIGVFTYQDLDDIKPATEQNGEDRAELVYLDATGNTVLRILNNGGDVEEPVIMPLGGRLTLYEATRQALVTPQIISQQKALNLAKTMMQRNVVLGGFLERTLLNAQMPGEYVDDGKGGKRFVPKPYHVGAGTTNYLIGIKYVDADGNEQVANPGIEYRDPVPVATFIESEQDAYLSILQEAQQLHYALAGDAVVSGESRKQARQAFIQDLQKTAGEVEAAARWVLETALAMAAYFAGAPGKFDGLRAYVQARLDGGPISPDDMRVAREMKDGGLWSTETAMSYTGIEDVDAELQRIERERATQEAVSIDEVEALLRRGTGGGNSEDEEVAA